jgi:hypothetical protein
LELVGGVEAVGVDPGVERRPVGVTFDANSPSITGSPDASALAGITAKVKAHATTASSVFRTRRT